MAARLIDASSRIAVCGQPPVSTPMMRSSGKAPATVEQTRILLGVDVVGDGADVVARAEGLAERFHQRRLAGADRPADADAKGSCMRSHERKSLVYWFS